MTLRWTFFLPAGQHVATEPTRFVQVKDVGQQNEPLLQLSKSLEHNFSGVRASPPAGLAARSEIV
jgi:hypothetical protein